MHSYLWIFFSHCEKQDMKLAQVMSPSRLSSLDGSYHSRLVSDSDKHSLLVAPWGLMKLPLGSRHPGTGEETGLRASRASTWQIWATCVPSPPATRRPLRHEQSRASGCLSGPCPCQVLTRAPLRGLPEGLTQSCPQDVGASTPQRGPTPPPGPHSVDWSHQLRGAFRGAV